jgi:colanic acid/amylovoran biosynthesis glycosyltransferase
MRDKKLTVIHSLPHWLPQTQTWLYNQIRFLPPEVEQHIVIPQIPDNLDQFFVPNIHALASQPAWRQIGPIIEKTTSSRFTILKALALAANKIYQQAYRHFLVQIARKYQVQVLHSHFGPTGWGNCKIAKQVGLKHVVTFYGYDVNQLPNQKPHWYKRYRTLFKHVDQVLCEGPHMAQTVVKLGCPAGKVQVHHLGVQVNELAFKPRIWQPSERLRVLIAASFQEKKGIPYALEALGQLQYHVPLEITVIGDASHKADSQAERQKILGVIKKHQLHSKTHLLGYQPYTTLLREAYKHHIFLAPSITATSGDTEGGAPVVIIEMMATGMHIVSTSHCDIPEIVSAEQSRFLAAERDVAGLINRLQWLINHPEQWRSILEAGRHHVETEFNANLQGKRLMTVYEML